MNCLGTFLALVVVTSPAAKLPTAVADRPPEERSNRLSGLLQRRIHQRRDLHRQPRRIRYPSGHAPSQDQPDHEPDWSPTALRSSTRCIAVGTWTARTW
jgi:hypothetical protein